MMTQTLGTLLTLLVSNPLFLAMQGTWVGQGERVFIKTGQRVTISTQVEAVVQGNILISTNKIRETVLLSNGQAGQSREYLRTYWVRPTPTQEGRYELGYGSDLNGPVASSGTLMGDVFEVEQDMGPAFKVRSETQFLNNESLYRETSRYNGDHHTETTIRYQRSDSGT